MPEVTTSTSIATHSNVINVVIETGTCTTIRLCQARILRRDHCMITAQCQINMTDQALHPLGEDHDVRVLVVDAAVHALRWRVQVQGVEVHPVWLVRWSPLPVLIAGAIILGVFMKQTNVYTSFIQFLG